MRYPSAYVIASACCMALAASATAAPWWYAGHATDRVLFIDAGSIEHNKAIVTYASKTVIRVPGNPVAMAASYMRADCHTRMLGAGGVQQIGYDEAVIDTSTVAKPKMVAVPADSLAASELDFVCGDAGDREAGGAFPLAIDDAAFTKALLAQADSGVSPRALHDRMAANPSTPVIRSTAAAPTSFGQVQTVKAGEPLVPPRDYARGTQIPNPKDYSSIETGRIYDIAYQGIKNGELQFEIRGYSIDDLVHPGSGQFETARADEKTISIRDLAVTIRSATPDQITYSVKVEKREQQ